jgi:glyoxylase-like metal-dependent hydrolase (beta-lactamase superfamily II)
MDTWRIGDIEVTRIHEMDVRFMEPLKMFPDATQDALEPHLEWMIPHHLCADTNKLILPIQGYLVRTARHTVLIDSCVGNDKTYEFFAGWGNRRDDRFLSQLAAAGAAPEDIDFVFCTHLHVDHCGWNTQLIDGRWVPTFPNARYVVSRTEYDWAEANAGNEGARTFEENVLPIMEAGQAVLVDMDHSVDDGLWLEPTPGHTPGHVAVNLASAGASGVMSGDLIHSPLQCIHPDWSFRFDVDAEMSRTTRRRFLENCCEDRRTVFTAHFPLPSVGRVVPEGDAFWFEDL